MALKRMDRSCRTGPDYRLATVKEAEAYLEWIKHNDLLGEWDRARLLDGWIGGAGYDFHVQVGFRSCLGYMLVVEVGESPTSEISSTDDRNENLYSEVPKLSKEGRSAALFLCCEDWNYEVLHWLIESHKEEGRTSGVAISVDEETEEASKQISAVARKLHGARAKSRVPRAEFSCSSMRVLMSSILESAKSLTNNIQESERGKIINENLKRVLFLMEFNDLADQCWEELRLTEDLKRFEHYRFDTNMESTWEGVADTVWYATADAMAVVILSQCSKYHNEWVLQRERMDDRAVVASLTIYAQQLLERTFFGDESLWKYVEPAASEAAGDCKRFNKILRDRGYGTYSSGGHYDVLNIFLVQAAKKGDVNLVERLIDSSVKPSETDDKREKTALHHAAKLDDESKGLKIAGMLLRDSSLENAVDRKKRSPLHRAAFCGHSRMCRLLLRHKASVESKDAYGRTPLHHAVLRQHNEEVVHVLISERGEDSVEGSTCLVDVEDNHGKTPLHFAVECQATNVRMVSWLLSLSSQPQSYFKMLHLSSYLREFSRMGNKNFVQELLKEGGDPLAPDEEGKTTFHCAAECSNDEVACDIICMVLDEKKGKTNVEGARVRDKYGRNVLHVAAFLGHKQLCKWLLEKIPNIDTEDRDGQSAIYYAAAGAHDDNEVLDIFIFTEQGTNQVFLKDDSQTTPLHVAAARGNLKMVEKFLSKRVISEQKRKEYVRAPDALGQTALHKAASGGHKKIVKKLLDKGANPLQERDCDGKTALHFATQAEKGEDAMAIAKLLLNECESNKQKSLLLFASAVGIGSAEQSISSNSELKKYLLKEKSEILRTPGKENLLRVAATLGNIDMTRELLTRGANIADICSKDWRGKLQPEEKKNVGDVLKQIDHIVEQGTDKPTLWDDLGRIAYANGLAALFLNPFVKSPITVGISGEWGTGKSSLMIQTECILLNTTAQLAFSNSFQKEDFPGASEPKLSAKGEARRGEIVHALVKLQTMESIESIERESRPRPVLRRSDAKKWDDRDQKSGMTVIIQKIGMYVKRVFGYAKNFTLKVDKVRDPQKNSHTLCEFLRNYEPKHHQIFKSLAVMDRRDMFEYKENEEESGSRKQRFGGMPWEEDSMQGTTPSILTVRYNAWQYRNESEAWAGLAVEITKELEATMTVAHKLRTRWVYNWRTRRNSICFGVIFPCFLAVFVAFWFNTIVWLLLDRAQSKGIKDFKYGSLPVSAIVLVWAVVKSVVSSVKPISAQIVDFICLPDHTQKLGYHQKVIFDINFLKDELKYRPSWLWEFFAFIWCCITFSWDENYVPGTLIPKMPPAYKDNLRIVVFIDDLDRCQENVILQILSAVNLVLAACEINVILGMDKSMIERAIIRKFGDKTSKPNNKSNQDLADKYLRKIIQLPLDLPDPSSSESQLFLQGQLGMSDSRKGTTDSEAQNERPLTYGYMKLPKFQMGTSIPSKTKLAGVETTKSEAETGAKQEKTRNISDTAQKGFQNMEREETTGRPGPRVEETKTENNLKWRKFRVKWDSVHRFRTYWFGNQYHYDKLQKSDIDEEWDIEQGAGENSGVQKRREDSESKRRLMGLSPITTEMLIPKYSEGEKNAFCFHYTRATRNRKLPREWKCLMTYHRLAWNILSKSPQVIPLAGWQVQLISWVFVCWQWKHLITILVQNWQNLEVLRKWITVHDIQKGEVIDENSGPSLREIVEHYIDERWPTDKKSDNFQGVSAAKKKEDTIDSVNEEVGVNCRKSTEEVDKTSGNLPENTKIEDLIKQTIIKELEDPEGVLKLAIRNVLQEDEVKDMLKAIIKEAFEEEREREKQLGEVSNSYEEDNKGESSLQQGTTVKENQKASHKGGNNGKSKVKDEEEEREEWRKLRETLSRYNVSMGGIQAFQKFRFYCEPGHLQWPFLEQA
ncbi:uncharacterized protein LOC131050819 isoform X2 [Cryptomeria japonica]|uniref:uncharacterized protein LOC131050819 isoform X2 n=1 Tax=Cryptomeria japonica TaxID=3369 RepID=UPI0027DA1222|nr:uncharacterized protein LOC131050819 isoform X2 [Cryptomeria japonica]